MPRLIKDNWLRAYLVYTHDILSPESFNLWCGVSAIASALQRKVFIPVNQFMCYPNNYIVLMGPPGTMKSTAMRTGREILSKVPNLHTATDSTTREKLILNFTTAYRDGHSSMTAHSSELASFFSSSKLDMVNFLTDIYDSPPEWAHDTKLSGVNKIKAPCLNLLAATTPDSFSKEVPAETSGIGLTSRMIIQFETKPRVRPWRTAVDPNKVALKDLLQQDLIQISSLKGEYLIDPEADVFYDNWFQGQLENPNTSGDRALGPYFARKHTHILKLSMVIAAASRDELVIYKEDIKTAMDVLKDTEVNMPNVFAGYGMNPLAFSLQQVAMVVLDAGPEGMKYQELLQMFARDVSEEDLLRVLATLEKVGQLIRKADSTGLTYVWKDFVAGPTSPGDASMPPQP
jgi:hypothetical protein